MAATKDQIRELAGAIANQAQAIADGIFPDGSQQLSAQAALLESNAKTLLAWCPAPDPGYCNGCGVIFRGARGLKAHQSTPFITSACKGIA